MPHSISPTLQTLWHYLHRFFWMSVGSCLTAFALEVFLIPNQIIDGGIVGLSIMGATLTGKPLTPLFLLILNAPFVYLAYKRLGKGLVIQMLCALLTFAFWLSILHEWPPFVFEGEMLEVIVLGGLLLGIGTGLIIRAGGCLDGTEILAILMNKKHGYTVGQVILFFNTFIFAGAGFVFNDWHSAIFSFMTFLVVIQIMDKVIVGMDETKSVSVISPKSEKIREALIHELELGVTILYGRGGYSGEDIEILHIITERLELGQLKEVIYREDPKAFVAIENLHEISNGTYAGRRRKGTKKSPTRAFFKPAKGSHA